jgi:hypothetical protein
MSGILERARGATHQLTEAAAAQADAVRGGMRTFLGAAALQQTLSSQSFTPSEIEFELTTLPRARLYFDHGVG